MDLHIRGCGYNAVLFIKNIDVQLMEKEMKKKSLLILAVILLVAIASLSFYGCNARYDTTLKEGNVTKTDNLTIREDGTFKILQLADLHLTTGGSYKLDRQTLRWVEEALEKTQPDLVELNGDAVGSGVKGRNQGLLALANIFEKKQVYWAYTFGNHDGEHSLDDKGKDLWIGKVGERTNLLEACSEVSTTFNFQDYDIFYGDNTKGNKELYELLKGYKYSLLARSEQEQQPDKECFMGVGNYVIELTDHSGQVKFALFHLDTHGKTYISPKGNVDPDQYIDCGYVGLTDLQVQWYREKIATYSAEGILSAIFMHIPSYGYRTVYETPTGYNKYGVPQFAEKASLEFWATQNTSLDNENFNYQAYTPDKYSSLDFIKQEGIYASRWQDNLFSAISASPSTILISVGHDHNNSFANFIQVGEQELMLAYGRVSGVNAWARDIPIGASVYTLDLNSSSAGDVIDLEIVYPSFKYTKYGNR